MNANLSPEALCELIAAVPCIVANTRAPATAFSVDRWQQLCTLALDVLAREHAENPESMGLNTEQLRMRTAPQVTRAAFVHLVEYLLAEGKLARDGSWLHLPGHTITLGEAETKLWRGVKPLLAETLFQPPRVRDIGRLMGVEEDVIRRLLRRLARMGQVYLVAHDHYYLPQAVRQLAAIIQRIAADHAKGEVYAAEFRTRIGTGRKLAIHILEFFDRIGYTRRVGDTHRIRNDLLEF